MADQELRQDPLIQSPLEEFAYHFTSSLYHPEEEVVHPIITVAPVLL